MGTVVLLLPILPASLITNFLVLVLTLLHSVKPILKSKTVSKAHGSSAMVQTLAGAADYT